MATMLFENNDAAVAKPASKVFLETSGFDYVNDELCFIFSTSEGKRGYGKQVVPVSQLDLTLSVLQEARDTGVQHEDYIPETYEVVAKSLIQSKDGSIRFKSQAQKGKKPTYCNSKRDFDDFVTKFESLLPMIQEKAAEILEEGG